MASTLEQLRELGYTVEYAYGATDAERDALAEAREAATEESVEVDVTNMTRSAIRDAIALGLEPEKIEQIGARVFVQSLREISKARDSAVAFHERSLASAAAMPTVYRVHGDGITGLALKLDDAGEPFDDDAADLVLALTDDDGRAERRWQHRCPKLLEPVVTLRARGYQVTATVDDDGKLLEARIHGRGVDETHTTIGDVEVAAETLPLGPRE